MAAYSMILTWSEDDGAYIVSVPDLPGCMADGATPNEAVENAKEVIQEWIETAQSLGRAVPEPTFNKVMI
ncbi:MAG: type II toxin-antitoxin system HicB family antitoxin [Eisenbergiella sp.]